MTQDISATGTDGGPARPDAEDVYLVVLNDEEQYSIWRADQDVPEGWHREGFRGPRQECLDHIERVWTDMRPAGLRRRLAGAPA